jgi:hypothetical protein
MRERQTSVGLVGAGLRVALPPYVISRLVLLTAAAFALVLVPSGNHDVKSVFTTWDSQWYVSIAEHGYLPGPDVNRPGAPEGADTSVDGAVAFFPLYPLVVAGIGSVLPLPLDVVAIGVALLLGAAAVVAYANLAGSLRGEAATDRAVLLFCFFPGAFIFSLAYPDGLLILLACLCLLQLQRKAWVLAGMTAALASATRPNGLALTVSCAVASFIAMRESRDLRSVVAPLLAPTGFLAFIGYLWWRTDEPGYWFRANRVFWHDTIGSWPELNALAGGGVAPEVRTFLYAGLAAGFVLLVVLVVLMVRAHLPPAVVAYALAGEALALLSGALAVRPRFLLAAFPLVMALGFTLEGRIFKMALAVSSAAMVAIFFFYVVLYLQGRYVLAP